MRYELVDRTFTPDNWRDSTYRRGDGSIFRVATAPIEVHANYGDGRVFLDRITYDEAGEHEMALRVGLKGADGE